MGQPRGVFKESISMSRAAAELEKKLKELEKNQRNVETKRKKIAALKSIGGLFEFATEKSIPQAIRLGYVFSKCPDGRYECIAPLQ